MFLGFFEMTLRSEESIKVIPVLLQAEKSHLHLPLKPMTSGLSLNTYRSNSELETKPNNPEGFVLSNFSTAWTTAVFPCKFHLPTARASGEEKRKVLWLETKAQQRDAAKDPIQMHWPASFWPPEHWKLDFFFILKAAEQIYEPTRTKRFLCASRTSINFSALPEKTLKSPPGVKNRFFIWILHALPAHGSKLLY